MILGNGSDASCDLTSQGLSNESGIQVGNLGAKVVEIAEVALPIFIIN